MPLQNVMDIMEIRISLLRVELLTLSTDLQMYFTSIRFSHIWLAEKLLHLNPRLLLLQITTIYLQQSIILPDVFVFTLQDFAVFHGGNLCYLLILFQSTFNK